MIELYNSLSQQKEIFKPMVEGKVKMYVCGMTVYDYCHIGHARVMVVFDMISRYLRERGYDVSYVRNITDVDDKIFARAAENGESFTELTERFIGAMHEDERALGVLPPTSEPRATAHMQQIVDMISVLMEKGVAYQADNGDVYFNIAQFPTYGKLSKRKVEELLAGARVSVEDLKRDPLDFVLWKSAKPGEASWTSPWGEGRPGWHIECSAMSTHCLGNTFDIHGGGPDLKFPHHENEIAQSEAATGEHFVNYWMHAGAVRVNKEKMSKSLGNFFTIREVLAQYQPEVVRFFLLGSHYRSQVDYSEDSLQEAKAALDRFYHGLRGVATESEYDSAYVNRFYGAMDDDFNTPEAIAVLHELVKDLNNAKKEQGEHAVCLAATLKFLGGILGLFETDPEVYLQSGAGSSDISAEEIEAFIAKRAQARLDKNWAESDRIRDALKEKGITLDDSRDGTTWRRG
ncbi:cysteinyl-tRNA synthetase [Oleiphilus messinensis]|uniref:Cysteine--tRNA ligase n=1 Tax=Oleiphilus messinensis TaxID=141451 RepID=A0A1Y0I728_9GAMM|nr:cysteinyl-tRNA synthetase [Oleiphilus messinensis]